MTTSKADEHDGADALRLRGGYVRPVLFSHGIREAEAETEASSAVTLADLMERAGEAVAAAALEIAPAGRVLVVCGGGNNGGDGWAAARLLCERGRDVRVVSLVDPAALPEPAQSAAARAQQAGVAWIASSEAAAVREHARDAALVVDAVLGIGLRGPVRDGVAEVLHEMAAASRPVLAVDVPSGIDADTGALLGPVPRAVITVTFIALKPGLLIYPAAAYAGEVRVADIGVPVSARRPPRVEVWEAAEYAALLPVPAPDAHKGDRGSVLIVAGSRLYAGAAVLAASGAMRMGAGYVFAAVPASVVPVVQSALPHVIAVGLAETDEGALSEQAAEHVLRLARDVDAVVMGPGLTAHASVAAAARSIVSGVECPLVLDADALNVLGPDGLSAATARRAPTVLTPHPGELARLLGISPSEVQTDRISSALRASAPRCACVLKGARTVVACADRALITMAGNPGMATAGMGDVLAGMTGTLLAQGLEPLEAAALAAYLHARAGDRAADELTEVCLTSKDLPAYLPAAVRELLGHRHP
ncbi:NAD(P)H-hydrate dehydratase [Coriobacteriia bacterium Es71-Z0120]|uniref:NAD(P)H-hydrate dehydratase n=1 Tax=Parvivirga hydrogeniphila TaxID=2939460 RepID=UPI002260B4A3|nr:NAD(P)H-hydrate dehydratase [Parvivirga hydrogeniphila]MCL4078574.1 NAD(P)H-hydrate dehydratase [Parvivirga hydrogeniphila]